MIEAIILQIVLIFLNAVFASAEIAVISMNETKLKAMVVEENKKAIRLSSLTKQPARFLATIQVAITMSALLGSAFAAESFAEPLANGMIHMGIQIPENILKTVVVFFITMILAYFNLVFGELVPKRIAMKKSDEMALGMSGMLCFVSKVFAPLVALLTLSTNFVLRLMRINPEEEDNLISEEEIRILLAEGSQQGTIDEEENAMIKNVFAFDDISVEQACTHRMEVISLNQKNSLEEWDEIIHETRHSYYPVYRESIDDIIGILDTKDYFRCRTQSKEWIEQNLIKKAFFIPQSKKANVLFQNMKQKRNYFAVIIDEYGGMLGIITLHDLLEVLVGDLLDEQAEEQALEIEKINDFEWKIYGHASLEEVSEKLRISLPTDRFDTYNGFVCGTIGRIPHDGECFECEYEALRIMVHSVENHRIIETTVQIQESA